MTWILAPLNCHASWRVWCIMNTRARGHAAWPCVSATGPCPPPLSAPLWPITADPSHQGPRGRHYPLWGHPLRPVADQRPLAQPPPTPSHLGDAAPSHLGPLARPTPPSPTCPPCAAATTLSRLADAPTCVATAAHFRATAVAHATWALHADMRASHVPTSF